VTRTVRGHDKTGVEEEPLLRESWKEGRETVGTWCSLPSPGAVETVAQSGFDWVVIDWQHGQFGGDSLGIMIQVASLAGALPLVRVPLNDAGLIQKALDLGAHGVIVPLVNTRAEAERAAAACRYPPLGVRSFGPIRSSRAIGWEPRQANAEIVCIVQIETAESLDNMQEISATPGVDALFVGPADLAIQPAPVPPLPRVSCSSPLVVTRSSSAAQQRLPRRIRAPKRPMAGRRSPTTFAGCWFRPPRPFLSDHRRPHARPAVRTRFLGRAG
jgi:4-hydroxy-2-oxoheptanedioate aldolase